MDPLYVCVACYRTVSNHPAVCRRCHVERLPLDNLQVWDDVRAEAERRVQKRAYREYFWLTAAAFVLTWKLFFYQILFIPVFWIAAGFGLGWLGTLIYRALVPKSGLALMRARKQRLLDPLAGGPADPSDAGPKELLAWLGARTEG